MREIKDIIIKGVSLEEVLNEHKLWLENKERGVKANLKDVNLIFANLQGVNLGGANLQGVNLGGANLTNASLISSNLKYANLTYVNLTNADLRGSNLKYVNLTDADLRGSNLTNADLDFSTLPLRCDSLKAKFDEKHLIQFLFHVGKPYENDKSIVKDEDLKELLDSELFKKVVNKFHRAEECGMIK